MPPCVHVHAAVPSFLVPHHPPLLLLSCCVMRHLSLFLSFTHGQVGNCATCNSTGTVILAAGHCCLGLQGDGKKGNRPVKRRAARKHRRKQKSGQGAAREAAHGSDDEVLLGQQHVLGDLSQVNLAKNYITDCSMLDHIDIITSDGLQGLPKVCCLMYSSGCNHSFMHGMKYSIYDCFEDSPQSRCMML